MSTRRKRSVTWKQTPAPTPPAPVLLPAPAIAEASYVHGVTWIYTDTEPTWWAIYQTTALGVHVALIARVGGDLRHAGRSAVGAFIAIVGEDAGFLQVNEQSALFAWIGPPPSEVEIADYRLAAFEYTAEDPIQWRLYTTDGMGQRYEAVGTTPGTERDIDLPQSGVFYAIVGEDAAGNQTNEQSEDFYYEDTPP